MQSFALAAGRRVAAGAVAGAAVAGSQPSAQARECVVQGVPDRGAMPSAAPARGKEGDEWLITDLHDQEVLVFQPYQASEIDAAIAQVHAMLGGGGPAAGCGGSGEVSPATTDTTAGGDADTLLGQSLHRGDDEGGSLAPSHALTSSQMSDIVADPSSASSSVPAVMPHQQQPMGDLLRIASKLLRRPGLQQEVFKVMLEDEEVRELMLRQSRNLDAYLTAVGIHNPPLLPPPTSDHTSRTPLHTRIQELAASPRAAAGGKGGGEDSSSPPPLRRLLEAVATCVEHTGSALSKLGNWVRDRVEDAALQLGTLMFGGGVPTDAARAEDGGKAREEEGGRGKNNGATVLGAVMVTVVAVMCLLVVRRPVVMAAAAAATAASRAAAASQRRTHTA